MIDLNSSNFPISYSFDITKRVVRSILILDLKSACGCHYRFEDNKC